MKHSETEEDVRNVEAWAAVVGYVLQLVPHELHMPILELAVREQKADDEWHEQHGLIVSAAEFAAKESLGLRHWHAVMRLKSLVVQVFTRSIKNNTSPTEGDAILFAEHPFGHGSCLLEDYLPTKFQD